MTNAQMQAVINAGGSVSYRGQTITQISQLPSDAQIAADAAAAQSVSYAARDGFPANNAAPSAALLFNNVSFDRPRGLQGKGRATSSLNGNVAVGATSIVLNAVTGLQPGQQIYVTGGSPEILFVDPSYVPGNLTVPLAQPAALAHSNTDGASWSVFAAAGPMGNLMNADGINAVGMAMYDGQSSLYRLAINAASDGLFNGSVLAAGEVAYNGSTFDCVRLAKVMKNVAGVAVTAGTPVTAWTPAAGKKFRLLGWMLSLSVAGAVIFKDGGAEVLRTCGMAAGQGQASPYMGNGLLSALANNVLTLDVSASGTVNGFVFGNEE